jgi:hypothetical protein
LVPFLMVMMTPPAESDPPAAGTERLMLSNRLVVTIHTPERLRDGLTMIHGQPVLRLDDGRTLPVVTDIEDPSIVNKGDGRFHPLPHRFVTEALASLTHPAMRMAVTVYLLPYPCRGVLVSSTVGTELFLSPHVLPVDRGTAAYIVAHEMGHAFRNAFLPDGSGAWEQYRRLRGIDDAVRFNDDAGHAYRPGEIFAEDFRVLFGGPEAHFAGFVENPELPSPQRVSGLSHFLARIGGEGTARRFLDGTLP